MSRPINLPEQWPASAIAHWPLVPDSWWEDWIHLVWWNGTNVWAHRLTSEMVEVMAVTYSSRRSGVTPPGYAWVTTIYDGDE